VHRNAVRLAWLLGIALTILSYAIGADRVLQLSVRIADDLQAAASGMVAAFTVEGLRLIRAMALGLFVVFAVLGVVASRRGIRSRAALLAVTLVFFALIFPALEGEAVPPDRWFGAFVLAGAGALAMTRRLVSNGPMPDHRRAPGGDPWGERRR